MIRKPVIVILLNILCCDFGSTNFLVYSSYDVEIKTDSPIVQGATLHVSATVLDFVPDGKLLQFEWYDNAIPQHKQTNEITSPKDIWNVTYPADKYPGGAYIVQVVVSRCWFLDVCYQIGSARTQFIITVDLNGDLLIEQHNQTITNGYVSTKAEVVHQVKLKQTDEDFVQNAVTLRTYWFVDCNYYGITNGYEFAFNYTLPYEKHMIEALVMADFTPLPTTTVPTTTSTTTATTSTTTAITSTTAPTSTTTTIASTSNGTTTTVSTKPKTTTARKIKRSPINTKFVSEPISLACANGSFRPYHNQFPMIHNYSLGSYYDLQKTYGYFYKILQSKDPLSKVNVTGNNWLQPGDMLSLRIRCDGSKNFSYCVKYRRGEYNITGNETCDIYEMLDNCDFTISRYLSSPKTTVLIIIENDINKVVTPVTVNIYKVKKQGQLSVIVVPVAFSLVAVVLIVFGVAYYFQNRSRFIIEVADFNFGQQYTDLEYKTFRERLKDSISNAFTRTPTPSSSEVPVWPPGSKYGSMT
ncbi:uncharacterized protein LOC130898479 isoform X1 [Diorhabda carinulata]|uniref:uncharacterized protein LOC130898479 isoform X1 n=1 Tax=Diorhabda carinulata TaxID=1163345 RepID=UPI0025A1A755|nr:uncharacterized protein LOC130898479 isoform X1 [Diorhabda carinulata]